MFGKTKRLPTVCTHLFKILFSVFAYICTKHRVCDFSPAEDGEALQAGRERDI